MKGYLAFLILWNLKGNALNGADIAKELEKRRGTKPSPGTIYPALKELRDKGFIKCDKEKKYSLTEAGEKELERACSHFCKMFYDMKEMFKCCKD